MVNTVSVNSSNAINGQEIEGVPPPIFIPVSGDKVCIAARDAKAFVRDGTRVIFQPPRIKC